MLPVLSFLPGLLPCATAASVALGVGSHSVEDQPLALNASRSNPAPYLVADPHPSRHPHGPHGPSWVGVRQAEGGDRWRRVTLRCPGVLKETLPFPQPDEVLRFTQLPAELACSLTLRGGAPKLVVHLDTLRPESETGWRLLTNDTALTRR